jgi:peptidoglycan biosynthesis protein MviN/MurJ (putative lipid II flippase)
VKCTLAAAVMGIGVFYLHSGWLSVDSPSRLWPMICKLTGLIAAGMIFYFAVAWILGCSELGSLREMVRPFLGSGKGEPGALRK